jgi:UDP-N-acetyl-D-mannosaminuronate dehydrogenase
MPLFAFQYLQSQYKGSLNGKKVLLLGVSYLNDVGDTRFTPVQGIYEQLIGAGCDVTLHDPHVVYWEEKELSINNDLNKLLQSPYDLVVITTGHKDYRNNPALINTLLDHPVSFVYDTIGILTNDEIKTLKTKHIVKVIGRGDL